MGDKEQVPMLFPKDGERGNEKGYLVFDTLNTHAYTKSQ